MVKKILVLLLVVVVVAVGVSYTLRQEAVCAKVIKDKAVSAVPGSVTVQAEYEQQLLSEVGGRLISSELAPGKAVKKGAVLAQIEPADLQLEIERIQSEYEAAKKRIAIGSQIELELKNAQEALANSERLTKLGNFPEAELVKQRRLVQQIEQRVSLESVANQQLLDSYENTLKVNKRKLSKMTITAPFDGVVAEVLARPGQLIGDRTPIALIIATSRTIEAKISEENFAGIKIGQQATVRFLGYGDQIYSATVSQILPTADPATQRYIVHLEVDIPAEKLVPGLTGEVTIVTGEHENALVIPRRALFGSSVYVIADNRVKFQPVKTGFTTANAVEITSGLKLGDLVIVDQLETFHDGDRVRVTVEENSTNPKG
jgi:RND family efflux transporter MFP subunit